MGLTCGHIPSSSFLRSPAWPKGRPCAGHHHLTLRVYTPPKLDIASQGEMRLHSAQQALCSPRLLRETNWNRPLQSVL